jgi:hypothetical protein
MRNGNHVILYIDDDQDYLDTVRVILARSSRKPSPTS